MSEPVPLALDVAVVMRKVRVTGPMSRWQDWRWELDDVVVNEPTFGTAPRLLLKDDTQERWLHPGYTVRLFRDDAEGYVLNATTPAPCWFVLWRMHESEDAGEPQARPEIVTLSYHDAGRWLDAQEMVEQVPAPPEIVAWMNAFIEANYVPEPKRRKRPASFQPLQDRFGNPASVSTVKKFRGEGAS
ncbi:DUF3305 domain-containing protein [Bordetella sp. 15P40C-2]|uniref:DUF3305 domain-containing protein n=1 Tax=Bordetella sp. 15P40C-2 TaxID=2572246 RepID=UPI00132720A8|nr:DUF3305 domain-containing protein [Bordetella sp. 15P40C-2]MVW72566.1 DUF3305 domain-containing protein [Bordetella sp. 15P40C-2]